MNQRLRKGDIIQDKMKILVLNNHGQGINIFAARVPGFKIGTRHHDLVSLSIILTHQYVFFYLLRFVFSFLTARVIFYQLYVQHKLTKDHSLKMKMQNLMPMVKKKYWWVNCKIILKFLTGNQQYIATSLFKFILTHLS